MSDIDFSNMKEIFIDDTTENIEIIIDKILAGEREKNISADNLNLLMRICHSVKGAARMLKLSSIAQTFHDFETLLKNVKEKKMAFEKYIVDIFLEGMDTVRVTLENMRQNMDFSNYFDIDLFNQKLSIIANTVEEENVSMSDGVQQQTALKSEPAPAQPTATITNIAAPAQEINLDNLLDSAADNLKKQQVISSQNIIQNQQQIDAVDQAQTIDLDSLLDSAAAIASEKVAVAPAAAATAQTLSIPPVQEPIEHFSYENADEETLADFISESTELIENLANEFVEVEEDSSPQIIDKIFRGMHTLKGGAGFIGLTKFQELAHSCENILDDIRNNKYKITSAIINEMLRANDIFTLYLNLLNNKQPLSVTIGENLARLKLLKENKGILSAADKPIEPSLVKLTNQIQKEASGKPLISDKPITAQPQAQAAAPRQQAVAAAPAAVAPQVVQQPQQVKPAVSKPQPIAPKPTAQQPVQTQKISQPAAQPQQQSVPAQTIVQPAQPAMPKIQQETIVEKIEQPQIEQPQQLPKQAEETNQPSQTKKTQASADSQLTQQTLRVELSKLDNLMNLVGELVINKIGFSSQLEKISVYIDEIESNLHHINLHLDNADLKSSLDLYENFQRKLQVYLQQNKDSKDLKFVRDLVKESILLFGDTNIINKLYENWKTMVVEYQQIANYYIDLYHSSTLLASKIGLLAKDLQENVMQTRMLPISTVFNKYKRTVRDLCQKVNKDIKLEIYGEDTEMDKNIIEKIGDPLTHIIRNSIDHGIEMPEERVKAGKPRQGLLKLSAYNKGGNVFIEVEDDGKGIDANKICQKAIEKGLISSDRAEMMSESEKLNLIFIAGFSTAEKVTEISGRGVGMDVVRENITKLKGIIDISTKPGKGTKLTIKLPLTLAILQVLQIREDNNIFAIPSSNIVEVFSFKLEELEKVKNIYMLNHRGRYIPVYFMTHILGLPPAKINLTKDTDIIIVGLGDNNIGLVVSEIVKKEEVVIKNLGDVIKKVKFVSGATIEGDGSITLILNIPEIIDYISTGNLTTASYTVSTIEDAKIGAKQSKTTGADIGQRANIEKTTLNKRILVVEDSTTTRKMIRSIIESAGFDVVEAVDGIDGIEKLKNEGPFNLITIDVNMPRLNGYGAVQEIRKLPDLGKTPIIMVTTRDLEIDKSKGFEAGVDDYIVKPFEPAELITVIRQYIK